jgi:hypothetical protein
MAPRAHWKGYLKLSLVSCPIALYPASSGSERVSFRRSCVGPLSRPAWRPSGARRTQAPKACMRHHDAFR